jgi:YggT family protein
MFVIQAISLFITYGVIAIIIATIGLMLLRLVVNLADLNPFGWLARNVRHLSDPLVLPFRGALMGFGIDPKYAPLIAILIVILLGWFALQLTGSVFGTVSGVLISAQRGSPIALIGYLLYGLLDLYTLLIFIRIIFSWGMISYSNPLLRFLVNVTDPLLVPLRRMIPPLGPFDISPIIAFIILGLFKAAIAGTLLRV